MKITYQRTLILVTTILVMVFSLFNPSIAFADDGMPPAEEPLATEETSPTPTDQPVSEIFEQIPENTEIIVLDDDNDVIPLATQKAAEIVDENDPMWCPSGQKPGGAGCTANYSTVTDLIANLGSKSGAGTIYFTSTYSINDAIFDHTNVNLSALTNLTIQGGWNGLTNASYSLSGNTTFNGVPLAITNWNGNITINNLVVSGAAGDGITVTTTGDINLNIVESSNNTSNGSGAILDNCMDQGAGCTGSGDVNLTGISSFNDNDWYGLIVESNGKISVNNISANHNATYTGVVLNNSYGAGSVTLTGINTFVENQGSGLYISSKGNINLKSVYAFGNGDLGAYLNNTYSGATGNVRLTYSNFFVNNDSEGLHILSNGNIILNTIIAFGNKNGNGVYLDNTSGHGDIKLTGINRIDHNSQTGLEAYSNGDITLINVISWENGSEGAYLDNSSGTGSILIHYSSFLSNNYSGLVAISNGNITLDIIGAGGNGINGASLITTPGDVCINLGFFTSNGGYGVEADQVGGSLTFSNVFSDGLNGSGDYLYGGTADFTNGGCTLPATLSIRPLYSVNHAVFLQVINVVDGEIADFNCEEFEGTVLVLQNGNQVTFHCPIEGSGSLTILENDGLPGNLPEGLEYISGIQVMQTSGESDITLDGQAVISFLISESFTDADLEILYWDGSTWVDLKSAAFADGRLVFDGGQLTGDGYFEASTNFSGIFVLVKK